MPASIKMWRSSLNFKIVVLISSLSALVTVVVIFSRDVPFICLRESKKKKKKENHELQDILDKDLAYKLAFLKCTVSVCSRHVKNKAAKART